MGNKRKLLDDLWAEARGGGKPGSKGSSGVDDGYVDQFIADANSYMDTIDGIINGISYKTAKGASYTQNRVTEDLQDRANKVLAWLDENQDKIDAGTYQSMRSQVQQFQDVAEKGRKAARETKDYYAQWDTEEDYNRAMRENSWLQKYQSKGYQELVPLLDSLEDGEEKTWLKDYAGYVDYDERVNMDLEGASREIQEMNALLKNARTLELEYNSFRENPLLMLTQGDTWRNLESRYDAFTEQYGSIEQLQADIDRKRQRMADAKALQDSIRAEEDYNAWTQSVRDTASIQRDLDALNAKIEPIASRLKEENKNMKGGISGISLDSGAGEDTAAMAVSGNMKQTQETREMLRELEQQRAALEQELQYSQRQEYAALMQRPDFERNSQYIPTGDGMAIRDNATGQWVNLGFQDIEYDYINRNPKAEAYQGSLDSKQRLSQMGWDRSWLLQMTDDERKVYNYLYHTEGKDAASEYLQVMRGELNRRMRTAEETKWAQYAQEHPYLASGATVMMAPLKGAAFVGQAVDYAADGRIDQNAAYNRISYTSKAIRDQVTQQIRQNEKWGQLGAFGYQTAMSMGDFLMNAAAGGGFLGVPGVTMAIMGSGAAADTVIDAKDKGIGDGQAFGLGAVAGLAEVLTERFSLEALLDADLLKSGIGVYVLKNSLTEGSEEVASSIINLWADIAISQEKSEWRQAIRGYQDMGYSEEEAFAKAVADQAASMGADFLGGMISGGVMSGAASAQYKASTTKQGKALGRRGLTDPGQVQQILSAGADSGKGTAANAVAGRLQKKLDAGQRLTAFDKGQLYQSNPQAVSEAVFDKGSVRLADPMVKGIDHKHEDWKQAQRLATITGREIRFYNGDPEQDGFYDRKTGEIFINVDRASDHQATYVFSHELTHSTELGDSYADLKNYIRGKLISQGRDWELMKRQKAEAYANAGHRLENDGDIEAEVVAQYVQDNLLTNEQELYDLFWAEPTIGQKILNWFDNLLAKYGKNDKSKERVFVHEARQKVLRAWESSNRAREQEKNSGEQKTQPKQKADGPAPNNAQEAKLWVWEEYEAGRFTEEERDQMLDSLEMDEAAAEGEAELGRQYSFAGPKARTADQSKLQQAKQLESEGVANEMIRQQTGWFKGMDGKWRYEIEARDASNRRNKTAEQRKSSPPRLGNEDTVFAEGNAASHAMTEKEIAAVQKIGRVSVNSFTSQDIQATERLARRYWSEMGAKSPFFRAWFGDWRKNDRTTVLIANQKGDTRGVQHNDDTGWDIHVSGKVFNESRHRGPKNQAALPYLPYINDIVRKAVLLDSYGIGTGKEKSSNSLLMHSLYAVADIGNGPEVLKLYVEEMNDPNAAETAKRAYQLQNIEKQQLGVQGSGNIPSPIRPAATIANVADLFVAVKQNDAGFNPNPPSKAVNDDGMPLVVYHGTNARFNSFASPNGAYWFSAYEDYAEAMMEERGGGEVKACYLNMKNPYYAKLKPGQFSDPSHEAAILLAAKKGGHDGVIIENDTSNPLEEDCFYVVFDNKQIKSATDNVGTFDGSNPDIRYSLNDGEAQQSLNKSTVNKRDVARDLRAILSRGGDPREMQQYVARLERNSGRAEQTGENRNSTAREILQTAHSNGQSVEEYLRWNPEQYERDGKWRPEALEAMRMEQGGGRQYSLATSNRSQTIPMEQAEQKAINTFGVTTDFAEAGFILASGKMLKFTDDNHPGERIYDHRAIGKVYGVDVDLSVNHGFNYESNDFMDEFVENGGIRFDPGDLEFNMDAGMQLSRSNPITREQEQTIRDFIEWKKQREENYILEDDPLSLYSGPLALHIDFGGNSEIAVSSGAKDLDAWGIKHLTYEGGQINASRIISDIRHYYRTGETRKPSTVAQFRYSLNEGESQQENTESQARGISREHLPTKAQNYLRRAESALLNRIGDALSVPRYARYNSLKGIIQEISDTYLQEGTVSDDKLEELFDKAYAAGIVTDAEFYNQYKEIKDHLRTYGVTISDRDKSDIPDFQDFRKRAFGTLRIVNEGGVPVDTAYQELQTMAPELFPDNITHPADQLMRMYEVGQSIAVSQKNLDEYYGHSEAEREELRRWAKNDFDAAVGDSFRDLKLVKRYAEERSEEVEAKKILTTEDAEKAYEELKKLRRNVDKVRAKNLLSESDEMLLGRMLKGEIGPQHLNPDEDNVKGITAVYAAKLAYESQCEVLAAYKRSVRAKHLQQADEHLETARTWKDKKAGILYARETMRRNILDIVPDRKTAERIVETYFESVHISEAKSTRFKQDYRNRVRQLNLSTKVMKGNMVSEAHAVQLLGEAMDNIRVIENSRGRMWTRDGKTLAEWRTVVDELWSNNTSLDRQKIEGAVQEFRKIYDELFQQMNRIRVENGYEPVNYRQGYFPHFQPGGDGIMAFFGKAMGINTQVDSLPTTINGLTHTFKPGIQWFGNAQERLGFNTAYDAVEGFDKYIEGVASVIYQTENIQRLRALATQVRYRTSDDGIRKQVDFIRMDNRLTEEEKQTQINAIYEHGRFSLSNFVAELDEYTNLLANKKSKYDRTMESLIGRRAYMLMKNWENRVGANMIAGNISSAMTNFIPLTQAGAQLDSGMILKGMFDTLKNMRQEDGLVSVSDFLTNRRGSDPLVKTWAQKASGILGTPMELIDNFTSESIVRAAYLQNLKRGLSEAEAMHQADIFASGLMADRSKGAMPTLFESRNPLFKAFTQFQLEVNNQFSEIFKDIPRNHREKGLAVLAMILLKYFLGSWLYNELFEKLIGRRPALDPIDMLNQTVGDLTGYEIPNLFDMTSDWLHGEEISLETEKVGIGEAGSNLATSILSELPFSAGLNLFGVETDGGRLPAASAVPDFSAIWQAATDGELTGDQRWKMLQDELNKLAYVIPPFGGGQISKSWKGIKAYIEGGSYSLDKDGDKILQYPVYKDDPDDAFWGLVRAALMGKNSLPEAQDWVENGYNSLNQYETVVYKDLLNCGVKDRDAFALVDQLRKVDETETEEGARRAEGRRILAKSDVSAEGKAAAFYGMVATEKEREWMDKLVDAGAEQADTMAFVSNLYDADRLKGIEKKQEQRTVFLDALLTEEEKKVAVGFIMDTDMETDSGNPTQYAKFLTALSTGLTVDKYMEIRATETDIEDYLELTGIGIKGEKAADLAISIDGLEPEEGYDSVTWIQRSRTILDSDLNEADQLAALGTVMYESTYEKVEIGHSLGMNLKSYVDLKSVMPEFDANGNGSYSQQETEDAINALAGDDNILFALTGTTPYGYTLTDREKAILWQLQNKSWKPSRNPFDREVGQMVYNILTADDQEDAMVTADSGEAFDVASLLALMN